MKKNYLFSISALAIMALPFSALAHEHQMFRIGGNMYAFTVGSLNEPLVVDDKSGVDLRVERISGSMMMDHDEHSSGQGVIGLEQTLKVEISAGNVKKVLDFSPAYNDPGAYRAPFYPTVQTTLTYRVFGTINNVSVDLSFTCNPAGHPVSEEDETMVKISEGVERTHKSGAFGCPVAKADLGFPEKSASNVELVSALADLGATSRNFTLLAMVLGVVGIALGGYALMKGKKGPGQT